jgi:hypothetical protein
MWLYENTEFTTVPDNIVGFVYLITNLQTGKQYIGKKLFTKSKRVQRKGKTKKQRVESDWRSYYGSNKELLHDVATLGHEHFKRDILHLCTSRGACSYHEARLQFEYGVLEFPEKYYNTWIMCRIHRKHLLNA